MSSDHPIVSAALKDVSSSIVSSSLPPLGGCISLTDTSATNKPFLSQIAQSEPAVSRDGAKASGGFQIERPAFPISTSFDYPPIPVRDCDWSAVDDNYDGAEDSGASGWIGRGATEEAAIRDLLENYFEMEGAALERAVTDAIESNRIRRVTT